MGVSALCLQEQCLCDADEPLLIMRQKKWTQLENRKGLSKGAMIFMGVTDLSQILQRPSPGLTLRNHAWGDAEAGSRKVILESLRCSQ